TPPRQKSFSTPVDALAVEINEASNHEGDSKCKTPKIKVEFNYKADGWYKNKDWDENTVAEVLDDQDGVIIYVSAENKNLSKLVVKAQRQNEVAVDNIKNKYLEHISFYAFMINQNKAESFTDEDGEPVSDDVFQKLKQASLKN